MDLRIVLLLSTVSKGSTDSASAGCQYMSPIPGGAAEAGLFSSGISDTSASVVNISEAIDPAF